MDDDGGVGESVGVGGSWVVVVVVVLSTLWFFLSFLLPLSYFIF